MRYRTLGRSGLRVSELSFGSWLTFGEQLDAESARACMRAAVDRGVNLFDNAEAYGYGAAESMMGIALRDFRRESVVICTKIFDAGPGPNDRGLSWKHLVEGTHASLKRLQLDYVDLLLCHRPDPETPIEETVQAMDHLVRSGCALYWGTSEWAAEEIEAAHAAARGASCVPPALEQPEYNLFRRSRVEREYAPLCERYGMGLTTYSPLASGLLTGKYASGMPAGSRLDRVDWLRPARTEARLEVAGRLAELADRLSCTSGQLAIAWCLENADVSSVITGAASIEQLQENLDALRVRERLDPEVLAEMGEIAGHADI